MPHLCEFAANSFRIVELETPRSEKIFISERITCEFVFSLLQMNSHLKFAPGMK